MLLKRYANRAAVFLDGDESAVNAALRILFFLKRVFNF